MFTFDRLLPTGGISIAGFSADHNLMYIDVNDISLEYRQVMENHPRLEQEMLDHSEVPKGTLSKPLFNVYVYKNSDLVGFQRFLQMKNSPYEFGDRAFLYERWVEPAYQRTKYVRYLASDLIHMFFNANIGDTLYGFVNLAGDAFKPTFYESMDLTKNMCSAMIYPTDGPLIQTYMDMSTIISTNSGKYGLLIMDGNKYRALDVKAYALSTSPKDTSLVDRWIQNINAAVDQIKSAKFGG